MSWSNGTIEEFEPLKLETLQSFNDEKYNRGENTEPDLDRFKVLYEPKKLVDDDPDIFEFLYDYKKEVLEQDNDFIATFAGLNVHKTDTDRKKDEDADQSPSSNVPKDLKDSGPTEIESKPPDPVSEQGFKKGFEQGRTQGYDKGFKQGMAEGLAKGEEQGLEKGEEQGVEIGLARGEKEATKRVEDNAKDLLDMLKTSLERVDQVYEHLVDISEEKILKLVATIAEKIIFEQIRINDEVVKHSVLDALKQLAEPEEVVLSVSVEDYETIEMVKESFFEDISSLKNISVISDTSIHRGGCRIKTTTATITADPKAKLDAIIDSMAKVKNR